MRLLGEKLDLGNDLWSDLVVWDGCRHDIDPWLISYGYNQVVDEDESLILPQWKPIQEWYTLRTSSSYITDHNQREYARIFAYMAPIRDALMCDIESTSLDKWRELTEILTINDIKLTQDLSWTPKEQYYSTEGIYTHLKNWPDFHPMMKYLEEAELELKCLAFENFNFTNPEGDNHCEIHGLKEWAWLILPG